MEEGRDGFTLWDTRVKVGTGRLYFWHVAEIVLAKISLKITLVKVDLKKRREERKKNKMISKRERGAETTMSRSGVE